MPRISAFGPSSKWTCPWLAYLERWASGDPDAVEPAPADLDERLERTRAAPRTSHWQQNLEPLFREADRRMLVSVWRWFGD